MSLSLGTIFVCIKQFKARLGDELSLQIGDRIEILADDLEYNDGWYMGRNAETNAVGLFPKLFTRAETPFDAKDPLLLRSRSRRVLFGGSSSSSASVSKMPSIAAPVKPVQQTTIPEFDKAIHDLQTMSLDPSQAHNQRCASGRRRSDSLLSLTQDLNPAQASTWTPKQVSSYFAIVLGFDMSVAGKFSRHKITGEILFQLDLPHLKELEIDSFGTRFEIYKEIEKLKQNSLGASSSVDPQPPVLLGPYNHPDETASNDELLTGRQQQQQQRNHSNRVSTLLPPADFKAAPPPAQNTNSATSTRKNSAMSNPPKGHYRKRSQSLDVSHTNEVFQTPNAGTFKSPRKAPEPPAHSPMNTTYKFGGLPSMVTPRGTFSSVNPYSVRGMASALGLLRPPSSIYDNPGNDPHRRGSSGLGVHRRHLSVFLFLLGNIEDPLLDAERFQSQKRASKFFQDGDLTIIDDDLDIEDGSISPKKSASDFSAKPADTKGENQPQGKFKSLRAVSMHSIYNLTLLKKLKTSAFQEGIREVNPDEAIKTSNFSGWMAKKSGNSLGWRSRYFTLHGTRLSYYASLRDRREKGLIDITAHKVLPFSTEGDSNTPNDKYIALYASLTGFGRYCFKLVPPAPGFKKGLMFTQPKTHYFAVETQDEMRGWLKALMTSTIDIDDTVPVVSSCNTPTVSLAKAQELLLKAREETKLKDEELRARGFVRVGESDENDTTPTHSHNDSESSGEPSPVIGSIDQTTLSSSNTALGAKGKQPKFLLDAQVKNHRAPMTPQVSENSGEFASPYLVTSGLLSPKQNASSTPLLPHFPSESSTSQASSVSRNDYFGSAEVLGALKNMLVKDNSREASREHEPMRTTESGSGKTIDAARKRSTSEKIMAYTSDRSFLFKLKKK